ncbi:glycosyltransferase [Blastochloris viridis]|uniref:1,2-diacylglycerol 3-glucosyltransferase n=1 Tax=Blastochloris viridis TaxID=1079 RepID=A0A0H5BA50_BLAVI|nr:glycosyltransferase [Blastochloris viridis]ALK10955.1 Processive diacylglycerol beta-glucosyltransferase [Blastochloris viridis]BAR99060.1 1,2-diacylglycerol 3-glucosyltransferase [Blastochloris viridis]CUU43617.1 Processive diacylglycerol glucosyltransferase [Blastochloris viridis]
MRQPSAVLEIVYFDAGGGHRSAMNALKEVLEERYPTWCIKPVNLQKLLEPADPVHQITEKLSRPLHKYLVPLAPRLSFRPFQTQDIYNVALKRGVTFGLGAILPILQTYIELNAPKIEGILKRYWCRPDAEAPDLVVSVIPNFNGVMFRALKAVHPNTPFVTVMTDMVDCPPHFWMEDQDQVVVCGTQRALEQAKTSGFYRAQNIYEVSGMILRKSFYKDAAKWQLTREHLGLRPSLPTAIIMFGGNGSLSVSLSILEQFEAAKLKLQTIVMCGNNKKLYDSLQGRAGCHAVGFVANVADYMRLADFLIGKPGPGSVSEAIHVGCPVIVECNKSTMPQERPNVDWILEMQVGLAVKSFEKDIVGAVQTMLASLASFKANIDRNVPKNFAVFEIATILNQIIQRRQHRVRRLAARVY